MRRSSKEKMTSIAKALVKAGERYRKSRCRYSLEHLARETGISERSLKELLSGKRKQDRIPYETVRKILNALRCSFAEFQELRNDRAQIRLLKAYERKKRQREEDEFVARLRQKSAYCTELRHSVSTGQCHDCWANLHDESWRHKYRKRSRCRELHIREKECTSKE
jgi:transcriptional regulator with XRE-family HTH domain